jgi:predicted GH43/DUF377 family glycosyl hydrolase
MKRDKKLLIGLGLISVAAILISLRFGQETPVIFKGSGNLCPKLQVVPFAETQGLIKRVTKVEVEGIRAPYNPGLLENDEGFFMVFRHDVKERKQFLGIKTPFRQKLYLGSLKMPFRTLISAVQLDSNFKPVSETGRIDTGSEFSEDPRLFKMGDQPYISYNDIQDNNIESRTIRIAKLDTKTLKVADQVDLAQNFRRIEKNWAPFICEDEGVEKIHFGYYFNPHVILKMNDPTKNELTHLTAPNHIAVQNMPWSKSWGIVRGGTPPILVDGQYLAFFHSFFREKGKIWYVMGAYTFESAPPFRVTACSPLPILFKGIYSTKTNNTAYSRKPSIFPSGLTLSKEDGKDVLHVACGENDCAVKIVTFDKEALLKSLTPIPVYKKSKAAL